MQIDLTHKRALVCGGSRGIGFAVSMIFSMCGCSVTLLARHEKQLVESMEKLTKKPHQNHSYIIADLSQTEQLSKIMENSDIEEGVDILVNNSSGPMPIDILECQTKDYLEVFKQQFLANQILTQMVVSNMKDNKFGRVINVVGTSIKEPIDGLPLSAVKAIVTNWAKALSQTVGEFGITVNNILPGPTNTGELSDIVKILSEKEGVSQGEFLEDVTKSIALKRIAEPMEIAKAIAFIASEHSSFITGSCFVIDGGYMSSY